MDKMGLIEEDWKSEKTGKRR